MNTPHSSRKRVTSELSMVPMPSLYEVSVGSYLHDLRIFHTITTMSVFKVSTPTGIHILADEGKTNTG